MSAQNPAISARLVSSVQKRDIMWNIIEPGDPYDIRKSMIAKLPGRKNYMGEHLQLVCLLQAAQIQRLCEYLEQYKLKLREVERRELDRHSYEVQIKELTLRIAEQGNAKAENAKLREFMRKQTSQFEQLRKHITTGSETQLVKRYEESLRQIELLMHENEGLNDSLMRIRQEFQQGLAAKNAEISELQRRIRDNSSQLGRSQIMYKLEVDAKKLEFQNRRLRQIGQVKARELQEVQGKCKQLIYELEEQSNEASKFKHLSATIQEYENRFTMFGQQIERLNGVLRDKTAQASELANRLRTAEEERRRQGSYVTELQSRKTQLQDYNRRLELTVREAGSSNVDESRTILRTYETNLEKLSLEIQRLNKVLRMKIGELEQTEHRVSELEQEISRGEVVKRQVEEFRSQFSELNRKMVEHENRLALSTQEIQRLNQVLRRKNQEAGALESQLKRLSGELEEAHNQYYHLEIEYKAQVNYLTTNYQARIAELQQESLRSISKQPEQKTMPSDTVNELDRLNTVIALKNTQIERLQSSLQSSRERDSTGIGRQHLVELESQLGQAREDNLNLRGSLDQYESRIILLSQEIDRLNLVIKKTPSISPSRTPEEQLERKIHEYENKLAILSQEIDRLNESLRVRDAKIRNYQHELDELRHSRDQQQAQRLVEAQYRIKILTGEVERLNEVLRLKVQEADATDKKFRSSARQAEDLRRRLVQCENTMEELGERIKGSLQLSFQDEISGYKRKIAEQEKRLADLETFSRDIDVKYRSAQQQSRLLEQQVRSYQEKETFRTTQAQHEDNWKINQYQAKIVALSKEIERLNTVLDKFNNENQELKRKLYEVEQLKTGINALEERLALAAQENQKLRKRLNDGTQSSAKLNQDYEGKIKQLTSEKDQLTRRLQEGDARLAALSQELDRLNALFRAKNQQAISLQSKNRALFAQSESLNRNIQQFRVTSRKIQGYQAKIALLSQQIDRLNGILRAKINDISTLEGKCRSYEVELSNYQRKVGDLEVNITQELQSKNAILNKENEQLRNRVRQLSDETARINEFQNKLAMTLGEVERLNSILKAKVNQIDTLTAKIRSAEQELQRSKRRNEELEGTMHRQLKNQSAVFQQRILQLSEENESFRRSSRELSDSNRLIPELQGKLGIASTEVDRLNSILLKITRENMPALEQKNKMLVNECDEYRRKCAELADSNKQAADVTARTKLLMQQNEQLSRKIQEYDVRLTHISAEIERLNGVLRGKVDELAKSQAKLKQSQSQNEQITRRYRDSSQTAKKIPEYESKIAMLGKQLQRLNSLLRSKGQELVSAQSKLRILQHQKDSFQRKVNEQESLIIEFKKQRATIEERLVGAGQQNNELRKTVWELSDSNRKLSEYESRLALLSQEVERLNGNLRMKSDQLAAAQASLRNSKRQAETKLSSFSAQLEEYRRKASENIGSQASRLAEYEGKMVLLSKQIERLNVVLKETTFELEGSRAREKQCLQEIERLNNTLRIKVQETTRWEQANSDLKFKLRSTEESLSSAQADLEKVKQQQGQLAEEYKKTNQKIVEYQQSINKLYQQFQRLQNIIQSQKKENYDLRLNLQEAGNLVQKNRALSAEIDRLMKLIEQQTDDLEQLRLALADQSALQKRINEYMALMVVLFAQIESLRRRVKDTEKEIQDVRRSSLAPFKV